MSLSNLTCGNADIREDATFCGKYRNLPKPVRAMFLTLGEGEPVDWRDLDDGLILAMQCALTAGSASPVRREHGERIMRIWDWAHAGTGTVMHGNYDQSLLGKGGPRPKRGAIPDLSQPELVDRWLAR